MFHSLVFPIINIYKDKSFKKGYWVTKRVTAFQCLASLSSLLFGSELQSYRVTGLQKEFQCFRITMLQGSGLQGYSLLQDKRQKVKVKIKG